MASVTRALTANIGYRRYFRRAGIIPFTRLHGEIYYFLTIDANFQELTDPGGHVKERESFLQAAVRELDEETLGIFNFCSERQIEHIRQNSVCYISGRTILILQPVIVDSLLDLSKLFLQRLKEEKEGRGSITHLENTHLVWISESHLRRLASGDAKVPLPTELSQLVYPFHTEKLVERVVEMALESQPRARSPMVDNYPPIFREIGHILKVAYQQYASLV